MISKFHQHAYLRSLRSFVKNIVKNYDSFTPPLLEDLLSDGSADFQIEGSVPAHSFLFSTSRGIYVCSHKDSSIKKLLGGKYYGMARYQDYWIFGRSNNKGSKSDRVSDIFAVKLEGTDIVYYKVLVKSMPGEIHQIDVFNNRRDK